MKKRFLAMLLCLSVLLMACACAAETESQAPTPQFTLSEVNAESSKTEEPVPSETAPAESEPQETISMEESDIELEPIQPVEPIKPEEKETTLEKVLSFDIGENGVFSYHFMYPQDSNPEGDESQRVSVEIPNVCAVDENGYLYFFHVTDGKTYIYCATTGEKFPVSVPDNISSISVVDGRFFLSTSNLPAYGFLEYSPKGLINRYVSDQYTFLTGLRFDSEGQPYVSIPDVGLQTLDGMSFTLETYPKISADKDGDQIIAYGSYQESITSSEMKKGIRIYGDRLIRSVGNTKIVYDLSDNALYQFSCNFSRDDSRSVACNISDGKSVVASFIPETFSIADYKIEAMAIDFVISWDGTLYLLAFYPDLAELYRIDPGYSDATGDEITAEEGAVASE